MQDVSVLNSINSCYNKNTCTCTSCVATYKYDIVMLKKIEHKT